ncbi:hypothetical protein DPMN_084952 [Dreissena polymorpha]|uniref:Uncharacterized protein n=1 Tax=Dreissena polymorpha TaxID=45954 RepID=A0A9D4BIZ8_DREPO|nr:hypothetical protein DPMN_084952 [Dreissena polymorpha]
MTLGYGWNVIYVTSLNKSIISHLEDPPSVSGEGVLNWREVGKTHDLGRLKGLDLTLVLRAEDAPVLE